MIGPARNWRPPRVYRRDRWRFVIPRVCVYGAHRGEGVTKEREKPDPVVERWDRERERERRSLSFSFQPYIFLSLTLPVAVTGWEVAAC